MNELRIGTRRDQAGRYHGVLRDGGKIVLECGHAHTNRDTSSYRNGIAGRRCMETVVRAARLPGVADAERRAILGAAASAARLHQVTARRAAEWHAEAVTAAAEYTARVAVAAALIGGEEVWSLGPRPILPRVPVPERSTA